MKTLQQLQEEIMKEFDEKFPMNGDQIKLFILQATEMVAREAVKNPDKFIE